MKVCIAGKNDIAVDVLRHALTRLPATELAVLPNAGVPERHDWQLSLRQAAREWGVRETTLDEVYQVEGLLFLSVEFADLIRPARFRTTNLVNIHFSNLPKYKGVGMAIWPIRNGETEAGVTLHRIAKGIDTGDVIAQRVFPLELHHTSRDLYFNFMRHGAQLIREQFDRLVRHEYEATPQPALHSTYYSRGSIDYSQIAVDFRATAWQVHNYVRAFAFYEYQLPRAFGWPLRGSELTSTQSTGKPGTIVSEDEQSLVVHTIDYDVRLLKDYSQELFGAAAAGDAERVRHLAARTHDLQVTNRQGWSALMVAAYNHRLDAAAALLDAGADLGQTNRNGTTVLMYAKDGARNAGGDTVLLELLLARGADVNARDGAGRTVLDYCEAKGDGALARFFRARGGVR